MFARPNPVNSLLKPECLQGRSILELGAGTGVFPACLFADTQWMPANVETIRWIASDRGVNLPLLRKNLTQIRSKAVQITAEELDWFQVLEYVSTSQTRVLRQLLQNSLSLFQAQKSDTEDIVYPDLIFCTDCVYNPALHEALIATLDIMCGPQTAVVITVQLREAENTRRFLSMWSDRQHYCTYSLEDECLPPSFRAGYACWVAWRC